MREVVESPLFLLTATLAAYAAGMWLRDRTGGHALAQPVVVAIVAMGVMISVLDVDYSRYRAGTELIAFLLGPATVALAIPLHRNAHRLRGLVLPMLAALVAGAVTSILTGYWLVRALAGGEELALTMAPKAATTPVTIPLADQLGGIPALAAVLAIAAGILGAIAGPALLNLLRVRDQRIRGLAVGAVSHGIGSARMLHEDESEGAFSGLAMGLTALIIAILIPLLL